jgi:hypothetical protein
MSEIIGEGYTGESIACERLIAHFVKGRIRPRLPDNWFHAYACYSNGVSFLEGASNFNNMNSFCFNSLNRSQFSVDMRFGAQAA